MSGRLAAAAGGVRGRVTFAVLAVTAVLFSALATVGFVLIADGGRDAAKERIGDVLSELETSMRTGDPTVRITTTDGVVAEALSSSAAVGDSPAGMIRVTRPIEIGGRPLTLVGTASQAPLSRSLRSLYRLLWVGVPVAAVASAVLAGAAVRRALRPVSQITALAESIGSAPGGARVPVPPTGDEIEQLARTVNAMLERVDAGHQAQRRFTSDAAHELRTPLMALRGEIELLCRGVQSFDQPTGVRLDALCGRLSDRIDDLVLLATIDEGRPMACGALDLGRLVADECAEVVPTATTALGGPVLIDADHELVRRAVRNLLANARRHARSAIAVSVTVSPSTSSSAASRAGGGREMVWIHVDDDGPGIPTERRSEVFERFSRLDEARTGDQGGAGLGLAVASSVATAHGGTATATVSPLGGARLSLSFPTGLPQRRSDQGADQVGDLQGDAFSR